MRATTKEKPILDVVNDAIGALSNLLHSLRARAAETADEAKSSARKVGREAVKTGKTIERKGKKAVRKVRAKGNRFLDKATKVWDAITNQDEDGDAARETATARTKRRAKKAG